MLKRLAILAVLLTIMQAPAPIPGQAANNPAGGGHEVQKQDGKSQPNAQPAASTVPENSTRPAKPNAEQPSTEDAGNSVTVRKLPTVSIGKDWADWSYWGFGGILVVVGSLQVYLLKGTLQAVEIQGRHMERQTKILEDSVAAAQKSADAALAQVEAAKSTQRAQFRIEFAEPEWTFNEELGGYPVHFRVILDGTTRAYVLDDSILAYIDEKPREGIGAWRVMGVPRNFTPELSPFVGYTPLQTSGRWPENETTPEKPKLARDGKLSYFVNGRIWYRDIFGDEWILEIDRYWKPWSSFGIVDATGGEWYPVGSGRYNTHRKVDTNRRDQYLKEKAN